MRYEHCAFKMKPGIQMELYGAHRPIITCAIFNVCVRCIVADNRFGSAQVQARTQ